MHKAAARLEAAEKAVITTAAAVTAAQAVANSAHAAWKTAANALAGSSDVYLSILYPTCHAAEVALAAANSALAAARAAAERAESEVKAAKAVAEKALEAADEVAKMATSAADKVHEAIAEASASSRKRAIDVADSEAIARLNAECEKEKADTAARKAAVVRASATRAECGKRPWRSRRRRTTSVATSRLGCIRARARISKVFTWTARADRFTCALQHSWTAPY